MAFPLKASPIGPYKKGDKVIVDKYDSFFGITNSPFGIKLFEPYQIIEIFHHPYKIPIKDSVDRYELKQYEVAQLSCGWNVPTHMLQSVKSMSELSQIILDKVKQIKGA